MTIWNGCKKAVYFILFAVLLPISAYIFYGALDALKYADALQGLLSGKKVPLFLLGTSFLFCVLFVALFRALAPWAERHWKYVVPAMFALTIALQILMVLTVRTSLRSDHLKVFDSAVSLLEGGTLADTPFKQYFMKYPNNIPLCLFTLVWLKIASVFHISREYWMEFVKLVNILFMNVGLFCTFRLICRHRSRKAGFCLLLLVLVNPLWYLLAQMYYTSTISLAFSMGAVWLFDCARTQEVRWKQCAEYLGVGILLAAGYKIRATVILTAASLLIYAVLQIRKLRISEVLPGLFAAFLGVALVFAVYGAAENRYAGFDPDETGYPIVHWVMMSAQGDGQYSSADDAYTGSFSTKEERTAADLALLKERLEDMGVRGLLTLFRNKMRVAFSDGTDDYYSLFRTMRETSPLQKYINGGRSDYLALYLHSYHGMLTWLVLLAFLRRAFRRKRNFLDIFAFNVCGAYLFYLIWEVDHAYSVPFMLMLLLFAADGMELPERAYGWLERKSRPAARGMVGVCALGTALVCAGTVSVVHTAGNPVREYSVLQDQETGGDLVLQTDFSQTFQASKPFDHVDIWVANWDGAANDSVYDVRVVDEAGNVVAQGELVGADAPCIDAYMIAFDRVEPERETTYRLDVSIRNPNCAIKTDFLYYQTGAWNVYGDGALYAPDEAADADLAFAVYALY